MNYLANDLQQSANNYNENNIFEDIFGIYELDRNKSTDYMAVFTDGSALVLCGGIWEFEMFDASSDEIEDI
jgi:hypothetical protein